MGPNQEVNAAQPLTHDHVMSQLAELDKLGQEGAAPVDDAEVIPVACTLPAACAQHPCLPACLAK